MEIDTAVQNTLRALTLSEKALAHELLYSEQCYAPNGTVWVRAPSFNLRDALEKARAAASKAQFTVRNYMIFCDSLLIDCGERVAPEPRSQVYHIEIFARRLVTQHATDDTPSLVLESFPGSTLR